MLFNRNVRITVENPPHSVLVYLSLNDKLSNVREKLKENTQIEMNDKLLIAKKISNTESLTVIAKENEVIFPLKEIISEVNDDNSKNYHLYLTKPRWTVL